MNKNRRIKAAFAATALALIAPLAPALDAGAEPGSVGGDEPGAGRNGAEAFEDLGRRAPEVAGRMGISAGELEEHLEHDETVGLDDLGNLLVSEDRLPEGALSPSSAASWSSTPRFDTATTFKLHSRPRATRKIYLDFTGHTMTGTAWNKTAARVKSPSGWTRIGPRPTIRLAPFDLDGDPSTFSAAEHAVIQNTYMSVREDFQMFDVDITTQDPGAAALTRSSASDTAYGIRVAVTPTDFNECRCGGQAYLGSFTWGSDTPAYVLNRGSKGVAEAVSHEVGHTLNLLHDGLDSGVPGCGVPGHPSSCEYYGGHGDWAPIMGNSYGRRLTQWDRGEYPNANNGQNDLAVMRANGLPTLVPDFGGTIATAYPVKLGTKILGEHISFTGDVDAYRFTVPTTRRLNLKAENWYGGSVDTNLNARLRLYDSAGRLLQTASPVETTGATLSRTVAPGTYYVRIDGVGEGSPAKATGYSSYGSLGRYNLTIV